MLSRSFTTAGLSQRASAQRRLRRFAATRRPLCSTNGCATFMTMDAAGLMATCPICGSNRQLRAQPH